MILSYWPAAGCGCWAGCGAELEAAGAELEALEALDELSLAELAALELELDELDSELELEDEDDELELELAELLELDDNAELLVTPSAHLESLITSWRVPFTVTASTVLGIDQLVAWFLLSRYCIRFLYSSWAVVW